MDPLKVIAVERRRRILEMVWRDELCAGDIAARFEVSWPAISQHLGVLKAAGFVSERREGRSRLYRANPEAMGNLRAVIESTWENRLEDLKTVVEADLPQPGGAVNTAPLSRSPLTSPRHPRRCGRTSPTRPGTRSEVR